MKVKVDQLFFKKNFPKANKLNVFCFPYAGGSAAIYNSLIENSPMSINVCPLEYPGRGMRYSEEKICNMKEIVIDLYQRIENYLSTSFVFLGYSMGAAIAYEMSLYLKEKERKNLKHLILLAKRPVHLSPIDIDYHTLSLDKFIDKLKELNGISDEVLNNNELLELYIPIIRNDFKLIETYKVNDVIPINVPLSVIGGLGDVKVPKDHLKIWEKYTMNEFKLSLIDGDHFFIHSNKNEFNKNCLDILKKVN